MSAEPLPGNDVLRLWSVTTLIRLALGTSQGLHKWGLRFTAETAVDAHDLVGGMIRRDPREAVDYLAKSTDRHARQAADRGTALHAAFEAIALGQEPTIPEGTEAYVGHFRRWLDHFQPEFLLAEAPVYNVTRRYAGTLDGICKIDGTTLLVDYKTTEHPPGGEKRRPPFPEVALQLAAYRNAEWLGVLSERRYAQGKRYYLFDPTARHEPMPQVDGALAVVISPYDCIAVPTRVDGTVWQAFLDVLKVARWEVETTRNLFGVPLIPWAAAAEEAASRG